MNITLDDMITCHDRQVARLDPNKNCATCKYENIDKEAKPCSNCFDFMLFIPVNPTNWEPK